MPILDIEIVIRPDERLSPRLAAELANRAGEIFDAPPGTTWVKVRTIARDHYGENGDGPPEQIFPVFVLVLKATLPPPEKMQVEVARLTATVARICGRAEENVHILYLPEGAGRISFGGKIVPAR